MTVIHVVPELRAAHIERFTEWAPGDAVLYRATKWDLGARDLADGINRLTPQSLVKALRATGHVTVEIPEPLWMRELPVTIVTALTVRLVKRRNAQLVAYCIENNSIENLLGKLAWGKSSAARVVGAVVGSVFGSLLDRVAFGSPGAMATYARLPGLLRAPHKLILELPAPTLPLASAAEMDVLFVGRLEERKGVRPLLEAWRQIESQTDSSITLVGDGPLRELVAEWARESPTRRTHVTHIEHNALRDTYGRHRILVAPSVRDGRWREQIGLPIKEGLSHGLTIVTTEETGLASWLTRANHTVVAEVSSLPAALLAAIDAPLEPEDVVRSLPPIDGRRSADQWMRGQ
ncbi:glycosyltransferase family 4 protein [uncultured Microbacterium sp.]|uniref:glycosyltransferase family 4 protein n=1 Tax=uncultured Microbacterium sp. TaxID=191216 RepID=UPI0028D83700|nr:glycosyltransferase family 4 protein [uncultured Microbacterium sp.]